MKKVIFWFRRDLRITDNTALLAAAAAADRVIPVYVLSTWKKEHRWTGAFRQHFLAGCLDSLDANLRTIGGRLIVRRGTAESALEELVAETGASAIYANRDPDLFGRGVEGRVTALCARLGVGLHFSQDVALHGAGEVLKEDGTPYRVFTPYSKAWLRLDKTPPRGKPSRLQTPPDIHTDPLPTLAHWGLDLPDSRKVLEPGERAARVRFSAFLKGPAGRYGTDRNKMAGCTTSRLSQDLRFGLLSIREVFQSTMEMAREAEAVVRGSLQTFVVELAWREFYFQILYHRPEVLEMEFNEKYRGLRWEEPDDRFEAWCRGRTGFPVVDAAMRQLLATGFMHNRARMITAMFLTKDLHVDWRHGEAHFMRHLVDGEIASNNGGWQWSAGTGADAAPYFRIQNPWSQTKRYDPEGSYVREWVPELHTVPAAKLMEPPADGRSIAPDYPAPIVNHSVEREKTLALFQSHPGT